MNTVSCPTCGAPVTFRSAASVMAVCDYCKSTLVKDAASVRNVGRMSDVLEDYSPIQVNTSGSFDEGHGTLGFVVVGRIQLRYDAGFWNEWYVLDDAGAGAWLSDASGQFAFTRADPPERWAQWPLPAFEAIRPGSPLDVGQAPDGSRLVYLAGDVRTARCTGGQGELPFVVGAGYTARVADFHRGIEFLTLDYSDTAADAGAAASCPIVYRGRAVALDALKPQLLRDPETIKDAAGRFKGKVDNLECPSCGAPIAFSPGATSFLVCPSCHASVDVSSDVAAVIAAAKRLDAVQTTIALGATATIAATRYTVIGLMRRAEIADDGSAWTEYLLYAPQKGFVWLVETSEGWETSTVLDAWPFWYSAQQALHDGATYTRLYDYQAVVQYAAGAFNWKVAVGDVARVTEFGGAGAKLAAESSETELTWSRSTPLPPATLALWFGDQVDASRLPQAAPAIASGGPGGFRRAAKWLTILLVAVNAIPMLFSPGRALGVTLFAIVALWVPAWMMDLAADRSGGG